MISLLMLYGLPELINAGSRGRVQSLDRVR
jgi:hypothetical protein